LETIRFELKMMNDHSFIYQNISLYVKKKTTAFFPARKSAKKIKKTIS